MALDTATSHPVATVPLHPIPAKHKTKSLRPFVYAFTAFGLDHDFAHTTSNFLQRRVSEIRLTEGLFGAPLKVLIRVSPRNDNLLCLSSRSQQGLSILNSNF
jgi:hypothetical protein